MQSFSLHPECESMFGGMYILPGKVYERQTTNSADYDGTILSETGSTYIHMNRSRKCEMKKKNKEEGYSFLNVNTHTVPANGAIEEFVDAAIALPISIWIVHMTFVSSSLRVELDIPYIFF